MVLAVFTFAYSRLVGFSFLGKRSPVDWLGKSEGRYTHGKRNILIRSSSANVCLAVSTSVIECLHSSFDMPHRFGRWRLVIVAQNTRMNRIECMMSLDALLKSLSSYIVVHLIVRGSKLVITLNCFAHGGVKRKAFNERETVRAKEDLTSFLIHTATDQEETEDGKAVIASVR